MSTIQNPACPQCGCKITVKKGKRRNRLQTHQILQCTECLSRFISASAKNTTYPLRTILAAVSTFNLGYSLTETQQLIRKRFHWQIPERTLGTGIARYRPLTTCYTSFKSTKTAFPRPFAGFS